MKKAFTFTEIMVSLTIIGFIVVLVLPLFFNTYGNKVVSAQLKKVCTMITNATKHVITDERSNDINSLESDYDANAVVDDDGNVHTLGFYNTTAGVKTSNAGQGAQYFLENYFKHTKTNCGSGGSRECVGDSYRTPDNTPVDFPATFYCIKTINDSTLCMRYNENLNCTEVLIDVNSQIRPNVTGSDVFSMYITHDGFLRDLDENEEHCNAETNLDTDDIVKYSAGCFHKILASSWNMRD